jgi:hypothetical protein
MAYSRVIRFRAEDSKTYFGEPEVGSADELDQKLDDKALYATIIDGTSPFTLSATPGERVKVEEILPLLLPEDVPIVRCIGLNYIKHGTPQRLTHFLTH